MSLFKDISLRINSHFKGDRYKVKFGFCLISTIIYLLIDVILSSVLSYKNTINIVKGNPDYYCLSIFFIIIYSVIFGMIDLNMILWYYKQSNSWSIKWNITMFIVIIINALLYLIYCIFTLFKTINNTFDKNNDDNILVDIITIIYFAVICLMLLVCYIKKQAIKQLKQYRTNQLIRLYEEEDEEGNEIFIELNQEERHISDTKPNDNENDKNNTIDINCIVCMNQPKDTVLFPCCHLQLCNYCSRKIIKTTNKCPICRLNITSSVKVIM